MSNTKGSMLISNANAVGTELVNQLGGTGYKPSEWSDAINLLGISDDDKASALAGITEGTYTGTERGAIKYSNCNAVGAMLNKKFSTNRGFKPVEWESAISKLTPLAEGTVSGAICNIVNGAEQVPLKNWLVTLPASLDEYTEVNGVRSGKNISSVSEYPSNPWDFWDTNFTDMVSFLNTLKSGTYTISFDFEVETVPDSGDIQYGLPYIRALVGGSYVNLTSYSISASTSVSVGDIFRVSASFTLTDECVGNVANCYIYCDRKDTHSGSTGRGRYNLINAQIEVGSTATAYSAYEAPTQYTASLGRTIYGGTADIVNGVGQETHATVDMGTLTWQYDSANTRFFTVGLTSVIKRGTSGWITDLEVDAPYTVASGTQNDKTISEYASTGYVYIKDTDYTDTTAFKASLSGKYLTYPLATPTDFTFTPVTIETALGVNNWWSDAGDSTITYRKDPDIPDPPVQLLNMNNNNDNNEGV